ncbi:unnamed protein product [Auanema sp. JU1783]|nr:unnamed protein product [Auanema sp. JU1783]
MSASIADLPKIPVDIAEAVTGKVELRKVETQEKNVLPTKEDVVQERQHVEMMNGIENFSANQLNKTETQEKVVLPSSDDIKAEKTHQELTQGIESFSPEKLKHTETSERVVLPSKEDLAREKTMDLAAQFDHNKLRHVEPTIKNTIEVIEQ